MSDNRIERERLQAEALKANLRRRKAQARGQKAAEQAPESEPGASCGNPGETAPDASRG
jgi:hypothetical protein